MLAKVSIYIKFNNDITLIILLQIIEHEIPSSNRISQ